MMLVISNKVPPVLTDWANLIDNSASHKFGMGSSRADCASMHKMRPFPTDGVFGDKSD